LSKDLYFQRYAYPEVLSNDLPSKELGIVVVIPCFDEPLIINTLESLLNCQPANRAVEVLVIINEGYHSTAETSARNLNSFKEVSEWCKNHSKPRLSFKVFYVDNLEQKVAGVGMARKIGMDEACRRLVRTGKEGLISCLDADCTVEQNYLVRIEEHFEQHPDTPGCSVYYEHPITDPETQLAIITYELHLRYYVHGLRFAKYPFAFHTVGSAMVVRSEVYKKLGGMNKKKAGEDFYFLNKVMRAGPFTELNDTTVYPSDRISERVPFGTGKAMKNWNTNETLLTYHPQSFNILRSMLLQVPTLYETDIKIPELKDFLLNIEFSENVMRIRTNSVEPQTFYKHFFQWFDNFKVMKLLHWLRDNRYPNIPVSEACENLLRHYVALNNYSDSCYEQLQVFRDLDKSGYGLEQVK
jgi:hypothetical protein